MRLLKKTSFIIVFTILLSVLPAGADNPKKIVSLAPSITESLYHLGLEEELIAVTFHCDLPEQTGKKKMIGTLINPNIEKIFSLSPDLVLALGGINRKQTIEKLKSLGLKVVVFGEGNSFDDIARNFVQLGKLTGKEEKAKEIVRKVEAEIVSITRELGGVPHVRVFWEVGAMPLVSVGRGSFANEFIRRSGGINIFANTLVMYPRVSREEVLKKDPEVIMLVTMGNVTAKEKIYWQRFKGLEAVKNGRIYIIDGNKVCRPTPLSFLTGLREVARLLHPEAFGRGEGI